ncbi:MAG TPA: energy-coupling factor transporter transmembrane component T [Anaerolineae bacterium]|nr:energy-coupling factor transporter transmembrane component T [Anaerolineae bacterium]HNT04732.1 energy-coupling factor transporter transmembrane component T [Anaerolineae bacterium]
MIRLGPARGARAIVLREDSPLRRVDPRVKLALSLGASLAVMLPLERLIAFMALYALFLLWARLMDEVARQVWRLKWILILLFLVDWLIISLDLAVIVTLRLTLLAGTFTVFFATTKPEELRLALEWLRVPHRYAFSVSLAFQSVGLLDDQWRAIREAQQSRGAWSPPEVKRGLRWNDLRAQVSAATLAVRDMVALSVPAIVLAVKHAWAMNEAAYARGFDSPERVPYHRLKMTGLDWLLLTGALATGVILVWVK